MSPNASSAHGSRGTVLLVDDNEDCQRIYGLYLRHLGYQVLTAWDGLMGVEIARDRLPDVIVMDIAMPRMDGLEATALLKANRRTAVIPVAIVTAHAGRAVFKQADAVGADAFLTKPCSPQDLVAAIEQLLAGAAGPGIERRNRQRGGPPPLTRP